MDWVENIERDGEGDRLSERNVNAQRVSEVETDKEMSAMMKDYDVVNSGDDDERSPPRLELAEQYREYIHSRPTQSPTIHRSLPSPPATSPHPLSTMNISSVRIWPVQVMAQAVMTLTHGHPRLTWPAVAKVNILSTNCFLLSKQIKLFILFTFILKKKPNLF